MVTAKKGLGKGLGALIPQADENELGEGAICEIKITEIEPNARQPRTNFENSGLETLASSIKEHGIVQPLVLKKIKEGYQIVAGERRWRAARLAGLKTVPAIIKNYSEKEILEVALVENLQRQDLNAIEEATAFQMLINEYGMTQEEVAQRVSRSRSAIANSLRLIVLPEKIKIMVAEGTISAGHARALLSLANDKIRFDIADRVAEHELSVRQTEELVKKLNQEREKEEKKKENSAVNSAVLEVQERMMHILGGKVRLTPKKQGGKIEIEYYNNEHLDRILELLEKSEP